MQCDDFREIADSYLSDELLIETNHNVIRHLGSCANCRFELASRRQIRDQLRSQFRVAGDLHPRLEFGIKLKNQLREQALDGPRVAIPRMAYVGIAASLLIAVTLAFLAFQSWRTNRRELLAWANLTASAAGDHRECALEHKLGPTIMDLNEAGRLYDRAYTNLKNEIVLPAGAQLIDAHSCVFHGRRFAHVVVNYHNQAVSVLLAKTEGKNKSAPEPPRGDLLARFSSDSYRMAYFQTDQHVVFVVSGLGESDNLTIAHTVAPALERHIRRAEHTLEAKTLKRIKKG